MIRGVSIVQYIRQPAHKLTGELLLNRGNEWAAIVYLMSEDVMAEAIAPVKRQLCRKYNMEVWDEDE